MLQNNPLKRVCTLCVVNTLVLIFSNGCLYRGESPNLVLHESYSESSEIVSLTRDVVAEQKSGTLSPKLALADIPPSEANDAGDDLIEDLDTHDNQINQAEQALVTANNNVGDFGGIAIMWPIKEGRISSHFGMRHHKLHAGLDVGAPKNAHVLAAASGQVMLVRRKKGYGNMIIIEHGTSRQTLYAHLNSFAVSEGDIVNMGDIIGYVGRTGRATGNHLHFETRMERGIARDPLLFLPANQTIMPQLSSLLNKLIIAQN